MRMRPRPFSLNGLVAVVSFHLGITLSLGFFTFYLLSFPLGITMCYSQFLLLVPLPFELLSGIISLSLTSCVPYGILSFTLVLVC